MHRNCDLNMRGARESCETLHVRDLLCATMAPGLVGIHGLGLDQRLQYTRELAADAGVTLPCSNQLQHYTVGDPPWPGQCLCVCLAALRCL